MKYQITERVPGVKQEDIDIFEERMAYSLPASLKSLLQDSDGAVYWTEAERKEVQFLGTVDMVGYFEEYGFREFLPDAIPFAMDGNGNFLTFRRGEGERVYVVNAGALAWEEARVIADALTSFMDDPIRPDNYLRKGSTTTGDTERR